jgi:hypothetical protein
MWRKSSIDWNPPDAVIVNPPRTGLGEPVTDRLSVRGPGRLVYVSCDPATLARDLARLAPTYRVTEARAFDLFPRRRTSRPSSRPAGDEIPGHGRRPDLRGRGRPRRGLVTVRRGPPSGGAQAGFRQTPLRILLARWRDLDHCRCSAPVHGGWLIQNAGERHEVEVLDERTAHIRKPGWKPVQPMPLPRFSRRRCPGSWSASSSRRARMWPPAPAWWVLRGHEDGKRPQGHGAAVVEQVLVTSRQTVREGRAAGDLPPLT